MRKLKILPDDRLHSDCLNYPVKRETRKVHNLLQPFVVSNYQLFVISSTNNRKNYQSNGLLAFYTACRKVISGSRGDAVVRALASHQCGPGLIPGPGVICGLSLLLVLALLRGFFSGFSGFPPSSKTNISKFQFDREFEGHGFIS